MESRLKIKDKKVWINDIDTHSMGLLITAIDININATDIPRATIHVVFPNGVDLDTDTELEYDESGDYEEEQEEG